MSLSAVNVLNCIQKSGLRFFRTADLITLTNLSPAAATQSLTRLARQNLLTKIKRGLWLFGEVEDVSANELLPFLTAPWPSYVSLYSALSHYSVVEEVPHITYGVTSGRPLKLKTALGTFHFHHLPKRLIWGYELKRTRNGSIPMAEPEKAFLDLIYLALTPRANLEVPHKRTSKWNLNSKKIWEYAKRFDSKPLTNYLRATNIASLTK
jgi:predicted transcriptional regulator of viral defense system